MRVLIACSLLMMILSQGLVIAQDSPEATETVEPSITLTIWWPDTFARVDDASINPILIEQADAFAAQFPNVAFEHRLKAVAQPGGIMSTLRSATNAARGALPTLTLVRRQDLLLAQSNGYLQSLEGFPSSIQGDLNNALTLGQVEDELYGIPYLLDFQHVVYRPIADVNYDEWTYDAVLERGETIVFPAGRINSLNDVLALQYMESGGMPVFSNQLTFSQEGLQALFDYYQTSVDNEILTASILNYTSPSNYLIDFINGDINAAIFSSTRYLALIDDNPDLAIAPIPTETGAVTSFLNGWMWVMVTADEREQALALDYLNWLFNIERQALAAEAVDMLPSRERAMPNALGNVADSNFYLEMIENSSLPIADSEIGVLGREIQIQFASILTLEQSADDALQTVINAVGE